MLEAAIIKTIKSTYNNVHLGYLPEPKDPTETPFGVVVSILSTRTLPQLKRTEIRQREAIINIKIFCGTVTETKDLQHKLLRLLDDVKLNVEARGYLYEMMIRVVNLNDQFVGTDKFSQLDISVHYFEHPLQP
ncbi:hypothetical protein HNP12_000209 [Aeromonas hydrophila]|uniref:hypothetical protein n=1 Tax=Aeromonas hydrophila TaxID=644 RepID=UPI0021691B4B|nr:hypothetical protein [Aeromonas hydrophila]MCS3766170.1 hypothetical protein [Aeromonas hydrophila]